LRNVDLAVAIARQIAGLQQAVGDARREQLSIPRAVVRVLSRIFPLQNVAEAFCPRAPAGALDESGSDAVALDRQRMIGVCDVGVADALEVRLDVATTPSCQ
jgi:hypothetical protein